MKKFVSLILALTLMLMITSFSTAEEEFVSKYGKIANGDVTLKIWLPMEDTAAPYIDGMTQNIAWNELQKRLGVNLEFIMPPNSSRKENFQLMVAGDDLPDIIQYTGEYVGGGIKGVEDGVFITINDYLDLLPDYVARMNEDPSRVRDCMEDDGRMYWIKNIMNRRQQSYTSLCIRGDWLEELGLEMPTTYDEMHDVLVAFKEKKTGGEAPFELYQDGIGVCHGLIGGFGVEADPSTSDWFYHDVETNSVVCSVFQPGYKKYVETMAKWYAEGLIDPNYSTNISPYGNTERIGSEKTGVFNGLFTQCGNYFANVGILPEGAYFDLVPPLVEKEGDVRKFGQFRPSSVNTNGFVITTACKNVEVALKMINYLYTDEGSLLANYGLEGKTFEYGEDGKPYVNDLIKANPNMNLSGSRFAYLIRNVGLYTYRDVEDDSVDEFQQKYMTVWDNAGYTDTMIVQAYLSYTPEESREYASIMGDASTYILEWTNKFITGITPMEKWDEFQAGLANMRLDRAAEIVSAAYTRYMNRSLE